MSSRQIWMLLRYTRWLLWLAWLAYCVEFVIHRPQYINAVGQLLLRTEVWMFGLPLAAVFVGCLELLMREKAGLSRQPDAKIGFGR